MGSDWWVPVLVTSLLSRSNSIMEAIDRRNRFFGAYGSREFPVISIPAGECGIRRAPRLDLEAELKAPVSNHKQEAERESETASVFYTPQNLSAPPILPPVRPRPWSCVTRVTNFGSNIWGLAAILTSPQCPCLVGSAVLTLVSERDWFRERQDMPCQMLVESELPKAK